jgi:hypothetical protein
MIKKQRFKEGQQSKSLRKKRKKQKSDEEL